METEKDRTGSAVESSSSRGARRDKLQKVGSQVNVGRQLATEQEKKAINETTWSNAAAKEQRQFFEQNSGRKPAAAAQDGACE